MPYIIDGHNLIPRIPSLSLRALDDEEQLIQILLEFCRKQRKTVEVFFDNSPPGQPRQAKYGAVVARFIQQGMTADNAIKARLVRLGKAAPNHTVVSSDLSVQFAARQARAPYMSSEAFSEMISSALKDEGMDPGNNPDLKLSSDEVQDWLKMFKQFRTSKKK
jgi:uncharacterized protein